MEEYLIKAQIREKAGTSYSRKLRREGKIPGIFYSQDLKPIQFFCEPNDLKGLKSHESGVVLLVIGDKKINGLIRDIQYEPVSDKIIHFDVMGIDLAKEVIVDVPVLIKGTAIGVKTHGGILQHINREVEIKCLPKDIPEHIVIDVTDLNIGHSVHVGDLTVEKGKVVSKPETVLVTIVPPTVAKVVEEEAEVEEEKEPEIIQKDKEEEKEE